MTRTHATGTARIYPYLHYEIDRYLLINFGLLFSCSSRDTAEVDNQKTFVKKKMSNTNRDCEKYTPETLKTMADCPNGIFCLGEVCPSSLGEGCL